MHGWATSSRAASSPTITSSSPSASATCPSWPTALCTLGIEYSGIGAVRTGTVLMAGATELARRERLLEPLVRSLMNLGTELLLTDLPACVETMREATQLSLQLGQRTWQAFSATNFVYALWTAGEWDEMSGVLHDFGEALGDPGTIGSTTAAHAMYSEARALPVADMPELPDTDTIDEVGWAELSHMLANRAAGDMAAAAASGERAVEAAMRWADIGDDFVHVWPTAVHVSIEAGDLDRADRLVELVRSRRPSTVPPLLVAHLHYAEGLLAAARDDLTEAEVQLGAGSHRVRVVRRRAGQGPRPGDGSAGSCSTAGARRRAGSCSTPRRPRTAVSAPTDGCGCSSRLTRTVRWPAHSDASYQEPPPPPPNPPPEKPPPPNPDPPDDAAVAAIAPTWSSENERIESPKFAKLHPYGPTYQASAATGEPAGRRPAAANAVRPPVGLPEHDGVRQVAARRCPPAPRT